jgi:hypothetical protein
MEQPSRSESKQNIGQWDRGGGGDGGSKKSSLSASMSRMRRD